MARVVISVGAQAERSLVDVVRPLVDTMKKTRRSSEADAAAIGKALAREANRAANQAANAYRQIERESARAHRVQIADADKATRDRVRAQQRAFDAELRLAQQGAAIKKRIAAEEERDILRTAATAAKAERLKFEAGTKASGRRALDVSAGAMRNMGGVYRAGLGVGRDVLRGAGVNWDIGSLVGQNVALESQAVSLSNAAFRDNPMEQRRDPAALVRQAAGVADKYAFDPAKVMAGLGKFQETTGDLDTAEAGLDRFAKLAKASGTDLDDMIASAGEISAAFDAAGKSFASADEKAQAIYETLKTLGAQGQEGAVEFRSLATQMPKLSAAAVSFEGDRGANIEKMGALVQLSKQSGGATSATQAATSIAGFANILKTPARLKQFEEAGVDVWSNTEKGKLADPFEIIRRSIIAKGDDPVGLKKMFANVVGAKPAEALAGIYRSAGGGEKGMAALEAALARFSGKWSEDKITGDVQAAMSTQASRVQALNNELSKVAGDLATKVGPDLLAVTRWLGDAAGFAVQNPGLAITAAITASIGKAAIGEAIAASMKSMIAKAGIGSAGLAGLIAAEIAMVAGQIESIRSGAKEGGKSALDTSRRAYEVTEGAEAKMARGEALNVGDLSTIFQQRAALMGQELRATAGQQYEGVGGRLRGLWEGISGGPSHKDQFEAHQATKLQKSDAATSADIDRLIAALQAKELKATVTVQQGAEPGVDPAGRRY